MTRKELETHVFDEYSVEPDYPFPVRLYVSI